MAVQPRAALAGIAQLPCWTAPETIAATGGALPAFSAYPQARPPPARVLACSQSTCLLCVVAMCIALPKVAKPYSVDLEALPKQTT